MSIRSVKQEVYHKPQDSLYLYIIENYRPHWPLAVITDSLDIIIADRILNEVWFQISDEINYLIEEHKK